MERIGPPGKPSQNMQRLSSRFGGNVQVSQVYCGESKDFDTPRTAEDLKLWKLLFRSPIPSWTKGKAVLTGDAAHPMLPRE